MNSEELIPVIELIQYDSAIQGLQGSYCWNGVCIDKLVPSKLKENSERTNVKKGNNISFKVIKELSPDEFQVSVFKGGQIVLKSNSTVLNLMLEEGKYVIAATAIWKGRGDVSYLFPIVVT